MATASLVPSGQSTQGGGGSYLGPVPSRIFKRQIGAGACPEPRRLAPATRLKDDCHRDPLAIELLPLVRNIAYRMSKRLPPHVERDDLVGVGNLGLLEAVRRFKPDKHVKIETYAQYRIRGAILDELRCLDVSSRHMRRKSKEVDNVHRNLEAELGRPPTGAEMAQTLKIGLREWYQLAQQLQASSVGCLRPVVSAGSSERLAEEIPSEVDGASPLDSCYRREQRDMLNGAIASLGERKRLLVLLYYKQGLTMKQIAARFRVSEARVSQLHSSTLSKLRALVRVAQQRPRPPGLGKAPRESNRGRFTREAPNVEGVFRLIQ